MRQASGPNEIALPHNAQVSTTGLPGVVQIIASFQNRLAVSASLGRFNVFGSFDKMALPTGDGT